MDCEICGYYYCYIAWIVAGRLGGLTVATVLEIFLWSRGVENLSVIYCHLWVIVLNILSVLYCSVENGPKKED